MKFISITCIALVLGLATTSCKDKETTAPSVEQQEMGTLPDTPADTIPIDTLRSAEAP
ncbi:hypothetical protein [Flavobacterium rhizosphaerae]|uniref:Cytochrome C551 n=1 Tax=Flavobacterium rhizosphaerae TaxID=3163298 RepID=A0ABW8YYP9_9FLAO